MDMNKYLLIIYNSSIVFDGQTDITPNTIDVIFTLYMLYNVSSTFNHAKVIFTVYIIISI